MKPLFIVLGFLFLGMGALGAMVPILPTVPFLLLASFFFTKSSKRINDWFISTGIYKKHLNDFVSSRAMTFKTKILILTLATCMLAIGFYFSPWYAKIVILLLMLLKYYYFIFRIRTIKKEKISNEEQEIRKDTDDADNGT